MSATRPRPVVADYETRAAYCVGEPPPTPPVLLPRLLRRAAHVAELPCGVGHFLGAYARAGVELTLIDASRAMLRAAAGRAVASGLAADRTHARRSMIQRLAPLPGVDAVVVPNGALNQLAAQAPPIDILAWIRGALTRGAVLLLQVLCVRPGATDGSAFYDPEAPDGVWRTDRQLHPARAAGATHRQRRQRHEARGTSLRIDFTYRARDREKLHESSVELRLLRSSDLTRSVTGAGYQILARVPGTHRRLTEILAVVPGASR